MTYAIETGIPIPGPRGSNIISRYPFDALTECGMSFFVPDENNEGRPLQTRLTAAATNAGRRLGRKYSTRRMDGGVRVWRIK